MQRFVRTALLLCSVLVWQGCGDAPADGDKSEPDTQVSTTEDTATIDTAEQDTSSASSDTTQADSAESDSATADTAVTDSGVADTTQADTSSNNECPGGAGCLCNANDDCDGGLCLEGAGGKRCAKPCVDNCDKGYLCAQVPQGSDVVSVCVDAFARLCSPCAETKDCNYAGVNDARCVDRGNQGRYCGVGCATANDCPQDYVCEDVVDVDDNIVSQCMPAKDSDGSAGVCLCNANAVSLAYKTKCSKSLPGQSELSCPGEAQCKAVGKAAFCQAKAPKPEACDGLDNDCDGKTDEDSCDDGNPCTTDSCDGGGCKNSAAVDGGPCDDGSVCTLSDTCKAGTCTAGKPLICDDGNACTTDGCDGKTGCTQVNFDGVPCDDDNPCTLGEVCGGGSCQPGKPKPCVSNDPCVLAKCDPKSGKCAYSDAGSGTPCDDGEPCTINEACQGGACKGAPKVCDDGDPCTADSCAKGKGCVTNPLSVGSCDDGDPCTVNDGCQSGKCVSGQNTCACQQDSDCKDDGDLCNGVPMCDTSKAPFVCKTKPSTVVTCNPIGGTACAPNTCTPATGKCAPKALSDGASCSDGDACTEGDACAQGKCAGGKGKACDDGNACTADSCDKAKGCVFTPKVGFTQTCYGGPKGTQGVGVCVAGKQTCDAKGQLGPCLGAVLPAKAESCDGKDDDCNGQTDESCGASAISLSLAPFVVQGSGGSGTFTAALQTGPTGDAKGNSNTLTWSLEALWRLWWPSK